MPHSFYYIVDYFWLLRSRLLFIILFFKIYLKKVSALGMHLLIKLTIYEYFLVL